MENAGAFFFYYYFEEEKEKREKEKRCTAVWNNRRITLHHQTIKEHVKHLKQDIMETLKRILFSIALKVFVLSFVLFGISAGYGMGDMAIFAAFLVFGAAAVLILVSPMRMANA